MKIIFEDVSRDEVKYLMDIVKDLKSLLKNDKQSEVKCNIDLLHDKGSSYEYWYYLDKDRNKIYHRDDDLPAFIHVNGSKSWYQHGKYHRETRAAVEWSDGDLSYWYYGKFLGKSSEGYTKEQFKQYKSNLCHK